MLPRKDTVIALAAVVAVISGVVLTANAFRPSDRRFFKHSASAEEVDAGPAFDGGNWPDDAGEMILFGYPNQSNGWQEAQDTTAQTTTCIDAGVYRGGLDASATLPCATNGLGSGGTGRDEETADLHIARGVLNATGYNVTIVKGVVKGGTAIDDLRTDQVWNDAFDDNASLDTTCTSLGSSCWVGAIVGDHGESDEIDPNNTEYNTDITTYLDEIYTELTSGRTVGGDWITGKHRPELFISSIAQSFGTTDFENATVDLQLQAAIDDPDIVHCGNNYMWSAMTTSPFNEPSNHIHMRYEGQQAKADFISQRCIAGHVSGKFTSDMFMYPSSIDASGSVITVDYTGNIPCVGFDDCHASANLAFDTTLVDCPHTGDQGSSTCENYGFEVHDPNPNPRYITSVAISGDTVQLTLNAAVQAGTTVSYAHHFIPNMAGGNGKMTSDNDYGSARGNLRDTTQTTGYTTSQNLYAWGSPFHDLPLDSGGATPDATDSTLIEDLNWQWGIRGEDCPAGTGAFINFGTEGGTFTNELGPNAPTCGGPTSNTPTSFIGGSDGQMITPNASGNHYERASEDWAADDDLMIMWAECGDDPADTETLFHWWGGTQEYFRIFRSAAGTLTIQLDTRGNGSSSGLMSQNLTNAYNSSGTTVMDLKMIYIDRKGHADNHYVWMCANGSCEATSKAGDWVGLSAAEMAILAQRNSTQPWPSDILFFGVMTGERARSFKEVPHALEDWYETQYTAFINGSTSCSEATAKASGLSIPDLGLSMMDESCLSVPEPPDASVRSYDGGADGGTGLTLSASDDWINCGGTNVGDLTVSSGVTHLIIEDCDCENLAFNINNSNDHIELYNVNCSSTNAGIQTLANMGDNWLIHSSTFQHDDDYAWFASDFDNTTFTENLIVYNSKFKGGPTQSQVRYDGVHCQAWVNNTYVGNTDTSPHNHRFQGGLQPDAGSGDSGSFGVYNAEFTGNTLCGGNGIMACNLNSSETCDLLYIHGNTLYSASGAPDPWSPNCSIFNELRTVNNTLNSITSYNPWNQGTGGCIPDANVHNQYDAATLPDGGCAF